MLDGRIDVQGTIADLRQQGLLKELVTKEEEEVNSANANAKLTRMEKKRTIPLIGRIWKRVWIGKKSRSWSRKNLSPKEESDFRCTGRISKLRKC
jgi:hypothetical protein